MTNTYKDDVDIQTKTYEEIRCVRCVLERILRVLDESKFVDYQLEKFSGNSEERQQALKKWRELDTK